MAAMYTSARGNMRTLSALNAQAAEEVIYPSDTRINELTYMMVSWCNLCDAGDGEATNDHEKVAMISFECGKAQRIIPQK